MAVFRIEKTRDYTVMSNHHLKDRTLTLKSKGLLSMMLSLPDEWNYTTRGLAAICREGVDSIGAALKELETHGYIRRTQLRDEKGKITDTEYVIYEMPQCEPPSSPGTPLPGTAKPYTENPDMGIPDTADPCTENPAQLNTNQTKTDLSSTEISNPTEEEKNFITLLDLINASEAREDDETYQSPVDLLFSQLEEREPDHFAVKQYRKFKMAAGKTLKSILISCGARLAPFDIKELRDLMEYDELELDTLGDQKTALFVILSDTDSTFNFVAALMYSQLFNLLCDKADDFYGGRLPVHVRLILDEFANIGQIPNFDKLIATIRSREISASIILQSQSQLKTIYKDAADTIVGNCDSTLFLGGKEKSTLKEISELLGKETIDLYNQSENRGSQVSHGLSYQKLGKELMTQDELAVMDGGKCIFMLRGVRPFLSDKYDLTRHPNYRYTADADPKNVFDMERYMKKQRAVVKPTDAFDVYEIDATT